jgi:hypothetical protein
MGVDQLSGLYLIISVGWGRHGVVPAGGFGVVVDAWWLPAGGGDQAVPGEGFENQPPGQQWVSAVGGGVLCWSKDQSGVGLPVGVGGGLGVRWSACGLRRVGHFGVVLVAW